MGKVLVIAEKPKTAKLLLEGLSDSQPAFTFNSCGKTPPGSARIGYYENPNIIIAYTRGHLMSLYDVEDYVYGVNAKLDKEQKMWKNVALPYIPTNFNRKITVDKKDTSKFYEKQFGVIKKLISRADVDYIVHYGDNDKEGELLVREVLEEAGNTKPVKRLFTNSLVPEIIAATYYADLQDDRNYYNLYLEALARQQTDWLLGINLTRYLTLKANTGTLWRVGRVIIPIVKFIYDRSVEIENFSSTKSFGINAVVKEGDFSKTISNSTPQIYFTETEREECEALQKKLTSQPATISNVEKKRYKIKPKKFMSQTDFRCEMNRLYGYSIEEITKVSQALYESGFITYPRTDTQYLSTKEKENVKSIIKLIESAYGTKLSFRDTKTIFDDEKVSKEGHTALTLTTKLPSKSDLDNLGQACKDGYKLILGRFITNFSPPPVIEETTVTILCGEYEFKMKGDEIIEKGFLPFEKRSVLDKLPEFVTGQVVNADFEVADRETRPPKPVSLTELLRYLSNPYEKELRAANPNDDSEYYKLLKEGVSIGTQSTVDSIISNAIQDKYIIADKKNYVIGDRGKTLIQMLDALRINLYKDRSVQLNKDIAAVGNRVITLEQNAANVKAELNSIIENNAQVELNVNDDNAVCVCPLCGGKVRFSPNKKFYYCENWKSKNCKFHFNEDDKFLSKWGVKVTKSVVSAFARNGFITFTDRGNRNNPPGRRKISVSFSQDAAYPQYKVEKISEVKFKK